MGWFYDDLTDHEGYVIGVVEDERAGRWHRTRDTAQHLQAECDCGWSSRRIQVWPAVACDGVVECTEVDRERLHALWLEHISCELLHRHVNRRSLPRMLRPEDVPRLVVEPYDDAELEHALANMARRNLHGFHAVSATLKRLHDERDAARRDLLNRGAGGSGGQGAASAVVFSTGAAGGSASGSSVAAGAGAGPRAFMWRRRRTDPCVRCEHTLEQHDAPGSECVIADCSCARFVDPSESPPR